MLYTNQKKENPKYINELDLTTNTISVGNKEHLEINKILLKDINWINGTPSADEKFYCRVRYNGQAEQCTVSTTNDEINIILDANIIRPSNGQSCVIYKGNPQQEGEVVGGGIIEKCSYINNAVPVEKSMKEYE